MHTRKYDRYSLRVSERCIVHDSVSCLFLWWSPFVSPGPYVGWVESALRRKSPSANACCEPVGGNCDFLVASTGCGQLRLI